MKTFYSPFLALLVLVAPTAFAGTATIYSDSEGSPQAQGSGTVNFNSYPAVSITISVTASADGASQQGGGRAYRGYAEAVIGLSIDQQTVDPGSDPMAIEATNSLTVTRGGDGNWYSGGTNLGTSVNVSSYASVDGENAVGGARADCTVSWVDAPANRAPTLAWNTTPGTVASGQNYTISAHGHDPDGNLTQVNVWKNGTPFAFAGGGTGTDGDSGNPTTDPGPATVTFTAQAVDSNGATSATISQTVTIAAPSHAPAISWNTAPGAVASGQSYTISAHGHDQDGNLAQVNVWKNGTPFAFAGGGNGTDGDSGNPTSDPGPATITFTAQAVDSNGATSATISQTVTVAANQPPTIAWTNPPGSVASGQGYTVSAHGHDNNGNLTAVSIWKNGQPFAFAGGGNGTDGDSSNPTSDTGPATVTFTAQAVDSNGASSATISQAVTVSAPPPTQYALTTNAGTGGGVSAGGTFNAGTVVTVAATADPMHDFAGWSGDATGSANPASVTLDRNKSVQANFTLKNFTLATSATTGGGVTPGGTYPAGSTVTLTASPDATHRFTGWTGDASGAASSVAVYLDRAKAVQAVFTGKTAQTISFTAPGNQPVGAAPVALNATTSSGLPITFTVLSGPAILSNGSVQMTGPGAVTIQAIQPGDGFYLPASPVTQTFNVIAPVSLKYRGSAGTLLNHARTPNSAPLVIQVP